MVKTGEFLKYQEHPLSPLERIPIENIDDQVPIYMYVGDQDSFASQDDARRLRDELLEVKKYTECAGFEHGTFTHFAQFPWFKDEILATFKSEGILPYLDQ